MYQYDNHNHFDDYGVYVPSAQPVHLTNLFDLVAIINMRERTALLPKASSDEPLRVISGDVLGLDGHVKHG